MTFTPVHDRAVIGERVLDELARGRTLRAVCRDPGMPDPATVLRWVRDDEDGYARRYRLARESGYHLMADDLVEIADGAPSELMPPPADGEPARDALHWAQLRVQTRRWLLAKALPRIYGERVTVTDEAAQERQEAVARMGEIMRAIDGKTRTLVPRR
jgi:hypothetical protein